MHPSLLEHIRGVQGYADRHVKSQCFRLVIFPIGLQGYLVQFFLARLQIHDNAFCPEQDPE